VELKIRLGGWSLDFRLSPNPANGLCVSEMLAYRSEPAHLPTSPYSPLSRLIRESHPRVEAITSDDRIGEFIRLMETHSPAA
jgi:hypothetical protein